MTIPRAEAMFAAWKSRPPQSWVVRTIAASLGVKFEAQKPKQSNLQELVDAFGLGEKPQWVKDSETANG